MLTNFGLSELTGGDTDVSWPGVGAAGLILDNLMAGLSMGGMETLQIGS